MDRPMFGAHVGDLFAEDPSVQPAQTPFWRESLFGLDWLALHASPVYYGIGIERGHGEPVVVVPGLLASNLSLLELHSWLERIGYRPYFSDVGRNTDCPDHAAQIVLDSVRRAHADTGQRVGLIGHSLGGLLARSVALDHPEYVSAVITLASPFRDFLAAHPLVLTTLAALRSQAAGPLTANVRPLCFSGHCTCNFVKNMLVPEPLAVPHYAIYSRHDGVVDWERCVEDDPALNSEVSSTHIGMVVHPAAYRAIAAQLAACRDLAQRPAGFTA